MMDSTDRVFEVALEKTNQETVTQSLVIREKAIHSFMLRSRWNV